MILIGNMVLSIIFGNMVLMIIFGNMVLMIIFGNMVLMIIFGPKRDNVTGGWRNGTCSTHGGYRKCI
jgi:hypothetical protein